ncbi:MAG TPA: peptidoglycan-binding domain-containing protein [Thermosynechococcaceae cyanobacterium]
MTNSFKDLKLPDTLPAFALKCSDSIREYCRLSVQRQLPDEDADRLAEILEQAESDGLLNFWIHEVDHFLAHELGLTDAESVHRLEDQLARLREQLVDESGDRNVAGLLEELAERLPRVSKELQQHLVNRGFDPGPVDGVWGPRTQAALVQFQRDSALGTIGVLDASTRSALGLG